MTMKKWHGVVTIIGAVVVLIILLVSANGNSVTNLYIIPAGTFSIFPVVNASLEKSAEGNFSSQDYLGSQDQKLMDAEVLIYEWDVSIPDRYKRNITIIHVSEKDFQDYPELEKTMLDLRDNSPLADGNRSHYLTGFSANLSDYEHWLLNSICRDKTRHDCYEDLAIFEYYGRHYDIGVAFF
jgi:hypothetical protein